jgi:SAM-dependent methyltransferase
MPMHTEDHFSHVAEEYARRRPRPPAGLYSYLARIAPGREFAWDCGTGSGQAAIGLARHFRRVFATDISPEQIAQAPPHEKIEYRVERAEDVSLSPGSVDLVTVAAAVHWFDLDLFYPAVARVLRPGGILAVWAYHLPAIDPRIDGILARYGNGVVHDYWPERFRYLEQGYRTLPFPFEEREAPPFVMRARWGLEELTGFVASWSATVRYRESTGQDPFALLLPELRRAWGEPGMRREIRWPLFMRLGTPGFPPSRNRPAPSDTRG